MLGSRIARVVPPAAFLRFPAVAIRALEDGVSPQRPEARSARCRQSGRRRCRRSSLKRSSGLPRQVGRGFRLNRRRATACLRRSAVSRDPLQSQPSRMRQTHTRRLSRRSSRPVRRSAKREGGSREGGLPFADERRSFYAGAAIAGVMLAFNRKKLSGSYFAFTALRRIMFVPKAVEARAFALSSACPVKFV